MSEEEFEKGDNKGLLIILGVVFLPALIVGSLFFSLLKNFKLKTSFISLIALITSVLSILTGMIFIDKSNLFSVSNMILIYLLLNIIMGSIGGTIYDLRIIKDIRRNPEKIEIKGTWMYKLKLKETPWEKRKVSKKIAKLKEGAYIEEDRSPLGIEEDKNNSTILDDETKDIVYRYDSEAVKHTLITGASGSGKALPLDTEIATPTGFTKLKELNIGDIIFDSNGKETHITGLSNITNEEEYEITFSNGSKIITSGDHRFVVYTLETRTSMRKEVKNEPLQPNSKAIFKKLQKEYNLSKNGEFITIEDYEKLTGVAPDDQVADVFRRFGVSHQDDLLNIEGYPKKPILGALLKIHKGYKNDSFPERMTVKEMMKLPIMIENSFNISLSSTKPVKYEVKKTSVSPYELGKWVSKMISINGDDPEDKERNLDSYSKKFTEFIKDNKDDLITENFLQGSIEQRIELLEGILSKEILSSGDTVTLRISDDNLLSKISELLSSLGVVVFSVSEDVIEFRLRDNNIYNDSLNEDCINFGDHYYVKSIKKTGKKTLMRCLSVKSDTHQFLVSRSYIPTSNTITLLSLMRKNILMHQPIVVIDLKRSTELASKLASWTKEAGGKFYHFVNGDPENYNVVDSPGQVLYDPLSSGTPGTNADMLLGMREWNQDSEHYKNNMQQVLQILFKMLEYGRREIAKSDKRRRKALKILKENPPTDSRKLNQLRKIAMEDPVIENAKKIDWHGGGLYQLASALKPETLSYLAELCKRTEVGTEAEELMTLYREKQNNPIKHAIQTLQGQLRTITASEYGRWLRTEEDGENLSLIKTTQEPGSVVLFSLNSDSEPEFAKFVGSIILSDLTNLSAQRRNKGLKNLVNVYVDEFQAVPPTSVTSLLEKSRESRVAMTLAQQSFDQIISSAPSNGQAYLGSILDTCSNFIIHAGSTEPSAIKTASILGKVPTTKYVFSHGQKTGRGKNSQQFQEREEMDWIIDPSEFMSLSMPDKSNNYKSTAIMINKKSSDEKFNNVSGGVARKIWMIPDQKVLDDYYEPSFENDDTYQEDNESFIFDVSDDNSFEDKIDQESNSSSTEHLAAGDEGDTDYGSDLLEEGHYYSDGNYEVAEDYTEYISDEGGFGFEDSDEFNDYEEDLIANAPYSNNLSAKDLFKGEGLNIGTTAPNKKKRDTVRDENEISFELEDIRTPTSNVNNTSMPRKNVNNNLRPGLPFGPGRNN